MPIPNDDYNYVQMCADNGVYYAQKWVELSNDPKYFPLYLRESDNVIKHIRDGIYKQTAKILMDMEISNTPHKSKTEIDKFFKEAADRLFSLF